MIVSSFPTTANGKLDRNALPDPPAMAAAGRASETAVAEAETGQAKPARLSLSAPVQYLSGLEEHVCRSVEQLRGRRPLPTASFATMGVDSLGAVLFLRLLGDSLGPGVKISPHSLYGQGASSTFVIINS
jgi:hypothetical protein